MELLGRCIRSFAPLELEVEESSVVFVASAHTFDPFGTQWPTTSLMWSSVSYEFSQFITSPRFAWHVGISPFDPVRSLGDFFATWLAGACIALAPLDFPLGRCLEATNATHVAWQKPGFSFEL